jgi:transposase-like protein
MEHSESRRRRVLSDSEKRAYIQRHAESGKSTVVFCDDEGIAVSSFQSWKRKFAEKPAFVEVSAPARSIAVEVVLASGDRIVTSSDCDPSWLAKFVRSLGAPPC